MSDIDRQGIVFFVIYIYGIHKKMTIASLRINKLMRIKYNIKNMIIKQKQL